MYPMMVALDLGGYFRSCFIVIVGKLVMYPTLIDFSSVVIVGEKRDTW